MDTAITATIAYMTDEDWAKKGMAGWYYVIKKGEKGVAINGPFNSFQNAAFALSYYNGET